MSRRVDVPGLLRRLGIVAERDGDQWRAPCPSPVHDDEDPSWSMVDAPGTFRHGSHYCFGCALRGGPWELAAAVWRVTVSEAGSRMGFSGEGGPPRLGHGRRSGASLVRRQMWLPPGVVVPTTLPQWPSRFLDYLTGRDVTEDQVLRWGVGFAMSGKLRGRVVFPVRDFNGRLVNYSARAVGHAEVRYLTAPTSSGARPGTSVFGAHMVAGDADVTVGEGTFQTLALERAGWPNPVGLLGSKLPPAKILQLSRFRRVWVATDPDGAGAGASRVIASLGRRAEVIRVPLEESPDDMPVAKLRQLRLDLGIDFH